MTGRSSSGVSRALHDNIAALTERARREAAAVPLRQKIADRITAVTGSMTFVALQVVLFGGWAAVNVVRFPGIPQFDPQLMDLATFASVEAIFLSTFVLISQNHQAKLADRRADLDLHITLLTEHELTQIASVLERIATRVGVAPEHAAFEELKAEVRPTDVLDVLDEHRSLDGTSPAP